MPVTRIAFPLHPHRGVSSSPLALWHPCATKVPTLPSHRLPAYIADRSGGSRLPRSALGLCTGALLHAVSASLPTADSHLALKQVFSLTQSRYDLGVFFSHLVPAQSRVTSPRAWTTLTPNRMSSLSHRPWLPSPPSRCRRYPFPQLIQAPILPNVLLSSPSHCDAASHTTPRPQ